MTDHQPPLLPVSEADRKAAARVMDMCPSVFPANCSRTVWAGEFDQHWLVQDFARHRLQSPPAASQDGAGMREQSSAEFHQRRGMLADAILAALHEVDEWFKDDDYNVRGCLDRTVKHLERVRDVAAMTKEDAALTHQGELQQGSVGERMSRCNKCGNEYPSAPAGNLHKCGSCSGVCYPITPPSDNGQGLREALEPWLANARRVAPMIVCELDAPVNERTVLALALLLFAEKETDHMQLRCLRKHGEIEHGMVSRRAAVKAIRAALSGSIDRHPPGARSPTG